MLSVPRLSSLGAKIQVPATFPGCSPVPAAMLLLLGPGRHRPPRLRDDGNRSQRQRTAGTRPGEEPGFRCTWFIAGFQENRGANGRQERVEGAEQSVVSGQARPGLRRVGGGLGTGPPSSCPSPATESASSPQTRSRAEGPGPRRRRNRPSRPWRTPWPLGALARRGALARSGAGVWQQSVGA